MKKRLETSSNHLSRPKGEFVLLFTKKAVACISSRWNSRLWVRFQGNWDKAGGLTIKPFAWTILPLNAKFLQAGEK